MYSCCVFFLLSLYQHQDSNKTLEVTIISMITQKIYKIVRGKWQCFPFLYFSVSRMRVFQCNVSVIEIFFEFFNRIACSANVIIWYGTIKALKIVKSQSPYLLGSYNVLKQAYLLIIIFNINHITLGKIYKVISRYIENIPYVLNLVLHVVKQDNIS